MRGGNLSNKILSEKWLSEELQIKLMMFNDKMNCSLSLPAIDISEAIFVTLENDILFKWK
jgi:hypothetical protein